jgi:putative toxin-antitoxin system antitoxin component (TIGR02293 family)
VQPRQGPRTPELGNNIPAAVRAIFKRCSREPVSYDVLEIIQAIHAGLPGETLALARELLNLHQKELAEFMGATPKTLAAMRRRKALSSSDSDKLYRLIKGYMMALAVFEDAGIARDWLMSPSEALGGAIPYAILNTAEGSRLVEYELAQIEYGQPA